MTRYSLRRLRLRPGEQHREEREIALEPFEFGGQRYLPVPQEVPAEFTVTCATSGSDFQLAFRCRVHGPCYRCLRDAVIDVPISGREYQASSPGDDEELRTPYVEDDMLDLSAWARDLIALALPEQILCRPDCAGLCPVCGADLDGGSHEHADEQADPRWNALAALRDRL